MFFLHIGQKTPKYFRTLSFLRCETQLEELLRLNTLPNDKILDGSKFKAFADNKISLTEKLKLVLRRVENIVGKGENAGYQHFLLSPQYFQKLLIQGRDCVVEG